jgi:hypothetical protein
MNKIKFCTKSYNFQTKGIKIEIGKNLKAIRCRHCVFLNGLLFYQTSNFDPLICFFINNKIEFFFEKSRTNPISLFFLDCDNPRENNIK